MTNLPPDPRHFIRHDMPNGRHPFDHKHGSLYDRGSADSYYRRKSNPHYGGVGGDSGPRVEVTDDAMVAEYRAGYLDNEKAENFKEWE